MVTVTATDDKYTRAIISLYKQHDIGQFTINKIDFWHGYFGNRLPTLENSVREYELRYLAREFPSDQLELIL